MVDVYYNTDDTTFYKAIKEPLLESVSPAVLEAQAWCETNSMILNNDKTVIMNISINYKYTYDEPVFIDNATTILPSTHVKFLGVLIDNHLTFSANVDNILSKCSSRIYLMKQLKMLGVNISGLKTFYCSNVRSILTYASPAWYSLLSVQDQKRLESMQRTATRIVHPNMPYDTRLELLNLPTLANFIETLSQRFFRRISCNPEHPLFKRITINKSRTSTRYNTIYRPKKSRTQKRAKSFFPRFMSFFNK
jgi:hypothetical protein